MNRNSLTTRAAVAACLLAFAALPALADSMTPTAPTPAAHASANAALKAKAPKKVQSQKQQAKKPASGSTAASVNGAATVNH